MNRNSDLRPNWLVTLPLSILFFFVLVFSFCGCSSSKYMYGTLTTATSLGFTGTTPGVLAGIQIGENGYELDLEGTLQDSNKVETNDGFSYGIKASGYKRTELGYSDIYYGVGVSYHKQLTSQWEKNTVRWFIPVRYEFGRQAYTLTYFSRDNTENETAALGFQMELPISQQLHWLGQYKYVGFTQAGERQHGSTVTLGIGVKK